MLYTDCPDSIEDAKQKMEHDRRVKQAELKKQSVRREVGRLRRTFLQLQQRNSQLGLPASEFIMDPHLEREMKERTEEQVREGAGGEGRAHATFLLPPRWSWSGGRWLGSQRNTPLLLENYRRGQWRRTHHMCTTQHTTCILALSLPPSLRPSLPLSLLPSVPPSFPLRFKGGVECERVTVWDFPGEHCLSSYRTPRPSPQYLQLFKQVLSTELAQTPWTAAGKRPHRTHLKKKGDKLREEGAEREGRRESIRPQQQQQQPEEELSKKEARRLRKEQRKREVCDGQ